MDESTTAMSGGLGGGRGETRQFCLSLWLGSSHPLTFLSTGLNFLSQFFFFNPLLMGGNSCNKVTHRNSSNFLEYSGIH